MKVALVHDHLVQFGGAERVLSAMHSLYPKAPIYTLLYDKRRFGDIFPEQLIRPSFLQDIPLLRTRPKWLLPFMPTATEAHNLGTYDVVLSSSSAFAKGIIPGSKGLHICYLHTPTRYLWSDTHEYIQGLRVPGIVKRALPHLLSHLRRWDYQAAQRVHYFIANSETVRRRIKTYYGRESIVLHPPVDVDQFAVTDTPKSYYLIGGRLVPYKRYDLVIKAFNKIGKPLKVFGSGPEEAALKKLAGPNIEFLGHVSDSYRSKLFEEAIAFLHPHVEDFGITPVESMAAGRPVIAFRKGGATETVIDGKTGRFFDHQSWEEIADTVLHFKPEEYDSARIRAHAETFAAPIFYEKLAGLVEAFYAEHKQKTLL